MTLLYGRALVAYDEGNYSFALSLLDQQIISEKSTLLSRQLEALARVRLVLLNPSPTAAAWAECLGLDLSSMHSVKEMRKRKLQMSSLLHPDKNTHNDAELCFKALQMGSEIIMAGALLPPAAHAPTSGHPHHCDWADNDDINGSEVDPDDVLFLRRMVVDELKAEVVKRRYEMLSPHGGQKSVSALKADCDRARKMLIERLGTQNSNIGNDWIGGFVKDYV